MSESQDHALLGGHAAPVVAKWGERETQFGRALDDALLKQQHRMEPTIDAH